MTGHMRAAQASFPTILPLAGAMWDSSMVPREAQAKPGQCFQAQQIPFKALIHTRLIPIKILLQCPMNTLGAPAAVSAAQCHHDLLATN
jgi:hypothetical protein